MSKLYRTHSGGESSVMLKPRKCAEDARRGAPPFNRDHQIIFSEHIMVNSLLAMLMIVISMSSVTQEQRAFQLKEFQLGPCGLGDFRRKRL